ncbi:hypothetical protein [Bacillus sp. FJAT-42376]|uniref:hypothetical protein n=1 Tax=Bacillus sp. FJAT-42376 TaxID=2014076 RepID=UPI0013DE4A8A|nr:hypothetical protein [Bacillus sp. FJAT-42376]
MENPGALTVMSDPGYLFYMEDFKAGIEKLKHRQLPEHSAWKQRELRFTFHV